MRFIARRFIARRFIARMFIAKGFIARMHQSTYFPINSMQKTVLHNSSHFFIPNLTNIIRKKQQEMNEMYLKKNSRKNNLP